MLPGYVFIFADGCKNIKRISLNSNVLRLLRDTDGVYELYGENLEYARWVLQYDGLIKCSKAIRLGSRIKVTDGPLKDYEGHIKEVSKKNRNGRVELVFMGRTLSVWLPFEWVEEG
jgi:transcription antitermination factor NusG